MKRCKVLPPSVEKFQSVPGIDRDDICLCIFFQHLPAIIVVAFRADGRLDMAGGLVVGGAAYILGDFQLTEGKEEKGYCCSVL